MSRGRARLALALTVGAAALGLLPLGATVGLLVRLPLLLWAPGVALLGWIGAGAGLRPVARLGGEACLSLASSALVLEALGWLDLPLTLAPGLIAAATVAALAWRLVSDPGSAHQAEAARGGRTLDAVVLAMALAIGLRALLLGPIVPPESDAGMQLAILERAVEAKRPVRTSPFLAEPVPWQYADAWHRLLATGPGGRPPAMGDAVALWRLAGALNGILLLLAFAVLALECFPAWGAGSAIGAMALLAPLDRLPFPATGGTALLWAGLGLGLAARRAASPRAGRALGLSVGLLAAGAAAIHPVEAYLLGGAWLAVALADRLAGRRLWRGGAALGLLALAAAAPVVLVGSTFLLSQVAAGEIIDPGFELRRLAAGTYVVDPRYWGLPLGSPTLWLALLLLPIALRRAPEPGRTVVRALLAAALVGLLFPPLAWLVVRLGLPSFLLSRAGVLFPAALAVGGAVAAARPAYRALILCALGLTVGPAVFERPPAEPHPLLGPDGRRLLGPLPRGSIILTDLWSADFLPALGGHRAVAGITWHTASTRDQLAVRDFLASPAQPPGEALDLLARRRVDFVLLTDWAGSRWDWPGYGSVFAGQGAADFLAANPETFVPAGASGRLGLWRVRRPLPASLALKGQLAKRPAAGAGPALATVGDFEVIGARLDRGRCRLALRVKRPTRAWPNLAVVAVPAGFAEATAGARLRRTLGGGRLAYASGLPPGGVRIDQRFHAPRELVAGEALELDLALSPAAGTVLLVGPGDALPPFPLPLGPVLARDFRAVRPGGSEP